MLDSSSEDARTVFAGALRISHEIALGGRLCDRGTRRAGWDKALSSVPKGEDSSKARATGIEARHGYGDVLPQWTPTFETSDCRRLRDSAKEHRFAVTQ